MISVALVEPEIPPNTGNIARLCAATGVPLHIVGVAGFRLDEERLSVLVSITGRRFHFIDIRISQVFTSRCLRLASCTSVLKQRRATRIGPSAPTIA